MSTKNPIVNGKNFYIYNDCLEAEKGVFIKFYQPESISLHTSKDNYNEVEICISIEDWKEIIKKIKSYSFDV